MLTISLQVKEFLKGCVFVENGEFKVTCFTGLSPERMKGALKGLHFKDVKGSYQWELDGHVFRIEPFQNQPRYDNVFGYRVYFNGSIDGAAYLFDLSLGYLEPKITGLEYNMPHGKKSRYDWIKDLSSRRTYLKSSRMGLFKKGKTGIVVLDDLVNLQIRPAKKESLKLIEGLKEIDFIRDELSPQEFDLFSCSEEGAVV